ncbi:MAG: guanylate kinase [Gammaproteobacteria bacterium]|nr:guanylate kinase [Gammaproteobacteria bacterium]
MSKRHGLIFIVSAPSGAGKTSLVKALIEQVPDIRVSVSHTTRDKRPNEVDGVHYYFVSKSEFLRLREDKAFIEDAEVFGHHYATSKMEIEKAIHEGQDIVLDIDWQGARQVKELFPEQSVGIFLLPPSKAILKERLERRAQDHPEVIAHRLAAANSEMQHYRDYDYVIINDKFDEAHEDLQSVIRAERLKKPRQEQHFAKLLNDLLA